MLSLQATKKKQKKKNWCWAGFGPWAIICQPLPWTTLRYSELQGMWPSENKHLQFTSAQQLLST